MEVDTVGGRPVAVTVDEVRAELHLLKQLEGEISGFADRTRASLLTDLRQP